MNGSENDVVLGRHLDSLSTEITRKLLTISGGESYSDFTGAGLSAAGLSGLVPAPAAGDENKFLRGNGSWSDEFILPTVANSVDGGFWLDVSGDVPVPKFFYGGEVYSFGGTSSAGGSSSATVEPAGNLPAVGTALNDCTWEQISAVSQAGLGATYWNVGDCKEITLNGKIGDYLTLDNVKLCVFILHFNYAMNGTADNNIVWGGFKTAVTSGVDVALVDSKNTTGLTDGTICFNMNHWGNFNYGGWKGCDFRYDILGATSTAPSEYGQEHTTSCVGYDATAATLTNPKADTLLAALPADFRNVLRLWSRWVDAKGNKSNVEANIEETIDAITLLSSFEISGTLDHVSNEYERNHQTQMAYYAEGTSTAKYEHANTSTSAYWFGSSPQKTNFQNFVCVWIGGGGSSNYASVALGLAPAFLT